MQESPKNESEYDNDSESEDSDEPKRFDGVEL